ncbi:Pr6Pr family membrane protein [Rathayibacter festucae]|uniref:Pr6Pr family membrane protein n=1 Tax=Rathayibacter festucae TaxID=110937 RepID=UPI002A698FBA|nr:Pr6Pr family membrane protein [Rathayibacter festucae]MDY0914606.1 Pr6Pr family membrane protein [Rathayibacter festucae]
MRAHRVIALLRWGTALLGAVVVVDAIAVARISAGTPATIDFLSSVTALSNILSIVVLAIAGAAAWRSPERTGRRSKPRAVPHARGLTLLRGVNAATLTSMSALFLVIYGPAVLGDPSQLNPNTIVLHLVIPVLGLLDWLLRPGPVPFPRAAFWLVLVFPVLWFAYTAVRGALTSRYVYEFLDPAGEGAGGTALAMTAFIVSMFFLIGVAVLSVQRRRVTRTGASV